MIQKTLTMPVSNAHLLRLVACFLMGSALAACSGSASEDGATATLADGRIDYAAGEAVDDEPTTLQGFPQRPRLTYTLEQRREIGDTLLADRENARYEREVILAQAAGEPPPARRASPTVEREAQTGGSRGGPRNVAADFVEERVLQETDDGSLGSFMDDLVRQRPEPDTSIGSALGGPSPAAPAPVAAPASATTPTPTPTTGVERLPVDERIVDEVDPADVAAPVAAQPPASEPVARASLPVAPTSEPVSDDAAAQPERLNILDRLAMLLGVWPQDEADETSEAHETTGPAQRPAASAIDDEDAGRQRASVPPEARPALPIEVARARPTVVASAAPAVTSTAAPTAAPTAGATPLTRARFSLARSDDPIDARALRGLVAAQAQRGDPVAVTGHGTTPSEAMARARRVAQALLAVGLPARTLELRGAGAGSHVDVALISETPS